MTPALRHDRHSAHECARCGDPIPPGAAYYASQRVRLGRLRIERVCAPCEAEGDGSPTTIQIRIDPTIPPGTAELRGARGTVTFINIGDKTP